MIIPKIKLFFIKLISLFIVFSIPSLGQINSQIRISGSSSTLEIKGVDIVSIPKFVLPKINIDDLLREDLNEQSLGKPFRFAKLLTLILIFSRFLRK